MSVRPVDYEKVLEDLKARRTALDTAIGAIEQAMFARVTDADLPAAVDGARKSSSVARLQKDTFFRMKVPQAIKKFLELSKETKSVTEITDGLQRGGIKIRSKTPYNTIYTALMRLMDAKAVVKIEQDWGLAGWYPGARKDKSVNNKKSPAANKD